MVARVGLGEAREPAAVLEVKGAPVDDHAANRRAMPTYEFCGGVNHDVRPVFQRTHEIGSRQGVVHHEGNAVVMSHLGDSVEVEHVTLGVTQRLRVEGLRVGLHRGGPRGQVVGIVDERGLDAQFRQRVVEELL